MCIIAVMANVCKNDLQTSGSPLLGSFGMPCCSKTYLKEVIEDQQRDLLYFVGYFRNDSAPWDTIIYKTDHSLAKIKVMTYDIYCHFYSIVSDPNTNFIYILNRYSNKIFEIRTSDLAISRELSVSSGTFDTISNLKASIDLYFSLKVNSLTEICRWDGSSTNLSCVSFGIKRPVIFAPIKNDFIFLGSTDSASDQYYLMHFNFSNPSNQIWKKSIACSAPSCANKFSSSILSRDESWIFTMILLDDNFIFLKLSVSDGTSHNSGLIYNDGGLHNSYPIKEFDTFIAVQMYSISLPKLKRLILVNSSSTEILKEYRSIDSESFSVGRLLYQGEELMYHCGRISLNLTFFFARSSPDTINQFHEFQEEAPLFTKIISTTSHQVSSTTSIPNITTSTNTLAISTSPTITPDDITSTVSPTYTTYVALWNKDHIESVQSNTSVQVDFTWACAPSSNYTDINFSLAKTVNHDIPEWVQLDVGDQELHLNKTPKLAESQTFYFSLKIDFASETHYKKFEIHVEECNILNCELCQLGSTDLCETCNEGYKQSDGQKSCSKITLMAGATEAAAVMVTSSVVLASASSVLSLSSVNSIFSIMNSLQLAVLLPLITDYFSTKVLDFLSGMGFTMMSFDFIKFKDLPLIKEISEWVSYPQSDEYLNSLGMRSGSSVVNYLSLMAVLIFLGVIHFGIFFCSRCVKNSKNKRCRKFTKKLFLFFTFNIYIRIFIQAFSFTSLSIFSEIYTLNLGTLVTKISFGLCIIFALCTSVLFILSFYMYVMSFPQVDPKKYWPCIEYFNGIKPSKFSKLYSSLFMLLRLMLSSLLILCRDIPASYKATYFYLLNIAYGVYLIVVRPFENPQDSVIEIINQTLFCCLSVPLSWLNTKEAWTPFYESYYITIFMISPAICSLICLIFLVKSIICYIYKRKCNKKKESIVPKKPSTHKRAPQNQEELNQYPSQIINHASSNMSRSSFSIMPPRAPQNQPNINFHPTRIQVNGKIDYHR
ncbi:unnamed protein product [Moneuplotes crassus]|uniref:Uncharacterized protein n=1 Tax=Euplotes crassus TaxID=5936 RepID=A0AAD1XXK5_EUPCR|nr:unnamed protein product [Moneuplotes crassus]